MDFSVASRNNAVCAAVRRKTDFFTAEENSRKIVIEQLEKHMMLFREDKKRIELIKQK
jgi:hypothetical protein